MPPRAPNQRRKRRATVNHDVQREPGIVAAGRYLKSIGAREAGGYIPVIGRDVGVTVAIMGRLGPELVRDARERRLKTQDFKTQDPEKRVYNVRRGSDGLVG